MRAKWGVALVGLIALSARTAIAQTTAVAPGQVDYSGANATTGQDAQFDGQMAPNVVVSDPSGGPYWPGGPRPTDPAQFQWPGGATFNGVTGQNDPRYNPAFGTGYDGVARLILNRTDGTVGCTGSLISSRIVLTAAHCVANGQGQKIVNNIEASFRNAQGGVTTLTAQASNVYVMGGYTGAVVDQRDLAIFYLDTPVIDPSIPIYGIYAGNPLHQEVIFAGYGQTGNGITGGIGSQLFDPVPVLRIGSNSWELTRIGNTVNISATPVNNILVADFDGVDPGGTFAIPRANAAGTLVTGWAATSLFQNNLSCRIFDGQTLPPDLQALLCPTGYGLDEVQIGPGDSGGPGFIRVGDQLFVAGVASHGTFQCFPDQRLNPDGTPNPRTDAGCPTGFVAIQGRFGGISGHVWTGGAIQSAFINNALTAPEPSTYALMATGLVGVAFAGWRRRKHGVS